MTHTPHSHKMKSAILVLLISFLSLTGFAQQQNLNVGTSANDHSGDPLRTLMQKAQANFTELYTQAIRSGTAGGTGTYTATPDPPASLTDNQGSIITFTNANPGTSTLNLSGTGAKTLKKWVSGSLVALSAGDIPAGSKWLVFYDATHDIYQINIPTASGGGGGDLLAANNLSDLASASTARTNLGLGTLSTQNGTFSGTSSGTNTGDQTSVTGNSGTATALQTARTINGVSFDGTANITVPAAASTLTGNLSIASFNSGTSATTNTFWAGDGTWKAPFLLTTTGTSGAATFSGGTLNIPQYSGGGSSALSGLTAATGTNTINNANNPQEWQWNTLGSGSGFKLSSTSTSAASNTNKLFEISTSGANGTSAQTTYGQYLVNSKTGTTSTNVGIYAEASGGTNNYAIQATGEVSSLYTSSSRNVFNFITSQGSTYGNFQHTITENNINADGQFDDVYRWGYNLGARRNSSEASLEWAMESHYQPFGNATDEKNFELHLESTSYNGTHRRILSFNISKNVGTAATFQTNSAFFTLENMDWRDTPTGASYYNVASSGQMRLTGITPQITLNESTDAISHTFNAQAGGLIQLNNVYAAGAPSFIYSSNYNDFSAYKISNSNTGTNAGTLLSFLQGSKTSNFQLTPTSYGTIPNTMYFNHAVTGRGFAFSSGAWGGYDMAINQGSVSIGIETTSNAAFYILQRNLTSVWKPSVRIDPGTHTGMTASTAFPDFVITGTSETWGSGTIAVQPKAWIKSNTINGTSGTNTATIAAGLQVDPWIVGTNSAIIGNFTIYHTGKEGFDATITAPGTTGNQTINKPAGTVNIAASGTTVTVTNSLCTTSSTVTAAIRTNDATAYIKNIVPGAGSFVINLGAAATSEISIGFKVEN